jgi:hypothetical protein
MGLALYRKTSFAITVVLITLGCFVAFLIQHKGWNYQLEAAWGCAFLLMGLSVGVFLQSLQKHFPNQSTLILLIAPGAAFFILSWNTYRSMDQSLFYQPVHLRSDGYDGTISMREIGPLAQVLLTYTKPGDKLLYLGNCGPEFPACIQLQLGQGSRFSEDTMLALSECLRTDKNIHSSAYQKRIIESYNADVQERRPKLILIQTKWTKNWLAPYDIPGKWLAEYERKPDYGEKYEVYLRKQLR